MTDSTQSTEVVVIRSTDPAATARGFTQRNTLDAKNSPTQGLSMVTGFLPPDVKVKPHWHPYEEVVYLVKGRARMFFGKELAQSIDIQAGDFLYIAPYVYHYPAALDGVACEHVIARNSAEEIIIYPDGGQDHRSA